jgi:hypothetical protein
MSSWNVLIATLGQRHDRFDRLLGQLMPQVEQHPEVHVTALWNNGELSIGELRHRLLWSATTDYVSFIDDDDTIPYYFVDRVVSALASHPDYVGWRMQCYVDGVTMKPTFHSMMYTGWTEDDHGYYRDVSHLNPIRTDIARRGDYRIEVPEDRSWAAQVRPRVHTEFFIPEVMYHYHSSTTDSTWRPGSVITPVYDRLNVDHPQFHYLEDDTDDLRRPAT